MKLNSKAFSTVEALLIVVIIAILGGTGYYVYNANKNTNATYASSAKSSPSPVKTVKPVYVDVKEWGVKFKVAPVIADANYYLRGNTAWLSTATWDKIPDCQIDGSYFHGRTYQGIVRHTADEKVEVLDKPKDGVNSMTAVEAIKIEPNLFKQVGSYVYEYTQGNGSLCSDKVTNAQFTAMSKVAQSLTPDNK